MAHLVRGELVYNDGTPVAEAQNRPVLSFLNRPQADAAANEQAVAYTNPHYETVGNRQSGYGDRVDSTGVFSVRETGMQKAIAELVAAESAQIQANTAGLSLF